MRTCTRLYFKPAYTAHGLFGIAHFVSFNNEKQRSITVSKKFWRDCVTSSLQTGFCVYFFIQFLKFLTQPSLFSSVLLKVKCQTCARAKQPREKVSNWCLTFFTFVLFLIENCCCVFFQVCVRKKWIFANCLPTLCLL